MTGSDTFTIPSSAYTAVYARRYGAAALAVAALPLLLAIVAGFSDVRWWIIALMTLFIVYPMVLTMAWLAMMAKSSMTQRLRPQRWEFMPDGGFKAEFLHYPKDDEEQTVAASCTIDRKQIAALRRYGSRSAFVLVKDAPFDFLLIPSDLVPDYIIDSL